jgi:hypothetical protein
MMTPTEYRVRYGRIEDPLLDRKVHWDYSGDWTACGKPSEVRLLTVDRAALTCRKCIARLTLAAR